MIGGQNAAPDKLSLVFFSGSFEKVHYGLVMASAALAIGRPVTLFFTMEASRAVLKPQSKEAPAWHRLLQDPGGPTPVAQDEAFRARGVAGFEELLEACIALEGQFLVCEMGLVAMGLCREDLNPEIPIGLGGVVTFLKDASKDGAMLFI